MMIPQRPEGSPVLKKVNVDDIGGWGDVPAQNGDVQTAIPATPTTPTPVAEQQSASAAATAVVQQTLLPPPPPPNVCVTPDGKSFSQAFYIWLLKLYQRVGGYAASSAIDQAEIISSEQSPRHLGVLDLDAEPIPRAAAFTDPMLLQEGYTPRGWFHFAPGVSHPNSIGTSFWDADSQTLATIIDEHVTLQHGQELLIKCVNKTGALITDGKVVYINDAQGNRPTIALAKADAITTCRVIGVVTEDIANNGTGFVTTLGLVHGFDTSGYIDGQALYLSATTAGALTGAIPGDPGYGVRVATALNSTVNGSIFVHPEPAIALDGTLAANTDLASPSQKAVKTYMVAGFVPTSRTISTTAPITGGGALSGNLTLAMAAATGSVPGYLTAADWTTFNGKQNALGYTPVNKAGDTGLGDIAINAVGSRTLTVGNNSANYGVIVKLLGYANTQKNWQIDVGMTTGGLNFVPSTTDGGSTFTTPAFSLDRLSNAKFAANVGFNGTTPIAKPTLNAAATDLATVIALANQIRVALINYGLCS